MLSRVVFPDPEGPINARNSPPAMSRETMSSAVTWKASRLKILLTARACTTLLPTAASVVGVVRGYLGSGGLEMWASFEGLYHLSAPCRLLRWCRRRRYCAHDCPLIRIF